MSYSTEQLRDLAYHQVIEAGVEAGLGNSSTAESCLANAYQLRAHAAALEEKAALKAELASVKSALEQSNGIGVALTTECREVCELFRAATGYTVDEYEEMRKQVKAEMKEGA